MCLKVYCYRFFLLNGMYFQSCRFNLYLNTYMSLLFKYRSFIHLAFILVYSLRDIIFFLMTIQLLLGAF